MSFSPAALDAQALDQLELAFVKAMGEVVGQPVPTSVQGRSLFAHALGHLDQQADTQRARITQALANAEHRRLLYWLLSTQMEAGIGVFRGLENLLRDRSRIGLPEGFDEVLKTWMSLLEKGQCIEEFFLRFVAPVDLEEALVLALETNLSSFQSALAEQAKKRPPVWGAKPGQG